VEVRQAVLLSSFFMIDTKNRYRLHDNGTEHATGRLGQLAQTGCSVADAQYRSRSATNVFTSPTTDEYDRVKQVNLATGH
jgi:hypothetical protein